MAAKQRLQRQQQQIQQQQVAAAAAAAAGIEVPKFYNPASVDVGRYAQQEQKRRLLWSKAGQNSSKTETAWSRQLGAVSGDAGKFCKLMGMRASQQSSAEGSAADSDFVPPSAPAAPSGLSETARKRQEEMFNRLESQYAQAQQNSGGMRGAGFGFSSGGGSGSASGSSAAGFAKP